MIANEVIQILSDLLKKDPQIEAVSLWLGWGKKANEPIFFNKVVKSLNDAYLTKQAILSALNHAEIECKKDKSIDMINIVLKTKINSNRIGAFFGLELKNG